MIPHLIAWWKAIGIRIRNEDEKRWWKPTRWWCAEFFETWNSDYHLRFFCCFPRGHFCIPYHPVQSTPGFLHMITENISVLQMDQDGVLYFLRCFLFSAFCHVLLPIPSTEAMIRFFWKWTGVAAEGIRFPLAYVVFRQILFLFSYPC